jgi:hypothetical protein
VEILKKIDNELSSNLNKQTNLISIVPFLDIMTEAEEYSKLEEDFKNSIKSYRKKLTELKEQITGFFHHDPVLTQMEELLRKCYFELKDTDFNNIDKEALRRSKEQIPPLTGGDSGKNENGFGDFYIWKHILEIEADVLFVTADNKADWFIKDQSKKALYPRRELIEEFYEVSGGKTFAILSPLELIKLFKADVDIEITKDLNLTNQRFDESETFFQYLIDMIWRKSINWLILKTNTIRRLILLEIVLTLQNH